MGQSLAVLGNVVETVDGWTVIGDPPRQDEAEGGRGGVVETG
jgi:hypothetical protein